MAKKTYRSTLLQQKTATQFDDVDAQSDQHVINNDLSSENTYISINGIYIEVHNLKKFGHNRTPLLNDISLSIPPHSFVALLGGSGAGKTTLMNVLTGISPADEGRVLYNGQEYASNRATFSTQIGYVPQDDIVHKELSVERALFYAAKMRLPANYSSAQIMQRIDEVLHDVEIAQHREKLIGKLSGGQRKRVSIALELLANPSVFFLDEPTSGLDPGLDHKMMRLLRNLANKGHTVILVTHTTSHISYCDYVGFLAPGGYLAYFGPPQEILSYFQLKEVSEIYTILEPTQQHPDIPREAAERFRRYQRSIEPLQRALPKPQPQQLRPRHREAWRQFLRLSQRYLELLSNDRGNLIVLFAQAPIISVILILLIHFGNNQGAFNPNNIVQCPTTAQIITIQGLPDIPTSANPVAFRSCQHLEDFLLHNLRGKKFASAQGGARKALQIFLITGSSSATTILFVMVFAALLFGSINAAREIVKEAPIYRRERAVNMGILPYMGSKIAVLGILSLLQSLVLVLVVNWVSPFHQTGYPILPLNIYITVALTALAGLMIGLALSALAPNNDRAMSFIPLIVLPQVIFSGGLFPLNDTILQYIGFLIPLRWAMSALGTIVGSHSDKGNRDSLFHKEPIFHSALYSNYSLDTAMQYMLLAWLVLGAAIIFFGCITAYCLKCKDGRR